MRNIDLKIERRELLDGGVGRAIRRARTHAGNIVDEMMQIYVEDSEVREVMKDLINFTIMLQDCEKSMDLLESYIEDLEKKLNINQEPPEPYCSDCGRGGD